MSYSILALLTEIICAILVIANAVKSDFPNKIIALCVAQMPFIDFVPRPMIYFVFFLTVAWCFFYRKRSYKTPAGVWLFILLLFCVTSWIVIRTYNYIEYVTSLYINAFYTSIFENILPGLSIIADIGWGFFIFILPLFLADETSDEVYSLMMIYVRSVLMLSLAIILVVILGALFFGVGSWEDYRNMYMVVFKNHPNVLGIHIYVAWPIALLTTIHKKEKKYFIMLAVLFVAILCLHSRCNILAVAFETVLIITFSNSKYSTKMLIFAGVCFIVASSFALLPEFTVRFTSGFTDGDFNLNTFTTNRYDEIWVPLLNIIHERPSTVLVGQGLYALPHLDPLFPIYSYTSPHNIYLEVLLGGGIIGALVYFSCFGILLVHSFFTYKAHVDNSLYLAFISVIIGHFIRGFFEAASLPTRNSSPVWLCVCFLLVLTYKYRSTVANKS